MKQAALILSSLLCIVALTALAAVGMTQDEYASNLRSAKALLDRSLQNRDLRSRIEAVVEPLSVRQTLTTEAGTTTAGPVFDDVDLQMLVPVRGIPSAAAIRAASNRLEVSLRSMEAQRQVADNSQTAMTLRETTSRQEFDQSNWEKLLTRIAEALNNVLRSAFSGESNRSAETVSRILGLTVIIGISGLIVIFGWMLLQRYHNRQRPMDAETGDDDETRLLTSAEYAAAAALAMESGEHIRAVRLWFSSILLYLNETGQIRLRDGMTNREAISQLSSPDTKAAIRSANKRFEECFFKRQAAEAADSEALLETHRQVTSQ